MSDHWLSEWRHHLEFLIFNIQLPGSFLEISSKEGLSVKSSWFIEVSESARLIDEIEKQKKCIIRLILVLKTFRIKCMELKHERKETNKEDSSFELLDEDLLWIKEISKLVQI